MVKGSQYGSKVDRFCKDINSVYKVSQTGYNKYDVHKETKGCLYVKTQKTNEKFGEAGYNLVEICE